MLSILEQYFSNACLYDESSHQEVIRQLVVMKF